ncbi:MAG: hypothetical protein ACP5XB_23490 [Isosphaeraceae bacterium]
MSMKRILFAAAIVTVLMLAAPHAQAQVVGGGYIGFGGPGFGGVVGYGAPMVAPAPVVPYAAAYPPVVVPAPVIAGPLIGVGWGYGPRYYAPRYYGPPYYGPRYCRGGYGRRW